eukprot:4526828-Prymnesium_polylepis.1
MAITNVSTSGYREAGRVPRRCGGRSCGRRAQLPGLNPAAEHLSPTRPNISPSGGRWRRERPLKP